LITSSYAMGRLVRLLIFVGCIALGGYFFGVVGGVVGFVLGGMLAMADVSHGWGEPHEYRDCQLPPEARGSADEPPPR
jgi:hypothetical protein